MSGEPTRDHWRPGPWRAEIAYFFEILALCTLVFAQPIFDSLRKNASDVFVHRSATSAQVLVLTLIVAIGPAVILWFTGFVLGVVWRPLRMVAHVTVVGLLVGLLIFIVVTRRFEWAVFWRTAIALGGGVAGAMLIYRFVILRQYLRFLSVAAFVFPLLFLTSPTVSPLVFGGSAAVADVKVPKPHRVVFIVFDELPTTSLLDGKGQVDAQLYPNFAALAGRSTWYRNTTTVSPFTQMAVPAIVSGSFPKRADRLPLASNFPHSVFTLLGKTYDMNAWEPASDALCPKELCERHIEHKVGISGLVDSARKLWNGVVNPPKGRPPLFALDNQLSAQPLMQGFVDSLQPTSRPRLDYMHVFLPHQPWNTLGNLQQYPRSKADGLGLESFWKDEVFAERGRQRHLLQLQATDAMLGRVITKLQKIGAFDDSLIVVTADHGAGFTANSALRAPVVNRNFHEVLWMPLFVKEPQQSTGKVDDRPSQNIDVLPTIASGLGVTLPWKVDGRSLLEPRASNEPRRFSDLQIRDAFVPPPSPNYQTYDDEAGFARVLATKPFVSTGEARARLYRLPGFNLDIGAPVAPLVAGTAPEGRFLLVNGKDYLNVNPYATAAPWTHVKGGLSVAGDRDIAVTVNGRIAGMAHTTPSFSGGGAFAAILDPNLFKVGTNAIGIYEVKDAAGTPRLYRVRGVVG